MSLIALHRAWCVCVCVSLCSLALRGGCPSFFASMGGECLSLHTYSSGWGGAGKDDPLHETERVRLLCTFSCRGAPKLLSTFPSWCSGTLWTFACVWECFHFAFLHVEWGTWLLCTLALGVAHHFTSLHHGEGGSTIAFRFYIIVEDELVCRGRHL